MKTYHDVIPISCLTEFPNVVQMAKVRVNQARRGWRGQHYCFQALQFITLLPEWHDWLSHSPMSLFCPAWTDDRSIASLLQDQMRRMRNESICAFSFRYYQLVCEEVNVDRFFPVLYPKVRNTTLHNTITICLFVWPTCTKVICLTQQHIILNHLFWLIKVWHWEIC